MTQETHHIEEKIRIIEEYEENADDWYSECQARLEQCCLEGTPLELLELVEGMMKIEFLSRCLGDIKKSCKEEADRKGLYVIQDD